MTDNFATALTQCLKWEGSRFTDDKDDKGGATRYGITQNRYQQYRSDNSLPTRSVRYITMLEVEAIYKKYYWDAIRGNDLPAVVDTVVFDAAVNHGPARAAKWLQALVGAASDGQIGPQTLAIVKAATSDKGVSQEKTLASRFCDRREQFYEDIAIGNQRKWLKGWMNRLQDLRKLFGLVDSDGVSQ